MELNPEVFEILKANNIGKSAGTLFLLAVYYKLDTEELGLSEEVIKSINLTKIVERDYENKIIKWNIPLFQGQQTEWDWVKERYNEKWRVNPNRKDSNPDVLKRMQDFFAKYPQYRIEDIMQATNNYFASMRDPQYLKSSAKFIFDGMGTMKKSMLLSWCEKLNIAVGNSQDENMRGKIVT